MPAADTVLLPLCVGLTLLGIIATGIAWRRGNKGKVVKGIALALAPVGLFFSGLLSLLWNGVVAVAAWASRVILSPTVWFGLSLLALCVVLWLVGSIVARRFPGKPRQKGSSVAAAPAGTSPRAVQGSPSTGKASKGKAPAKAPVDEDLAEIEALLKSRGID